MLHIWKDDVPEANQDWITQSRALGCLQVTALKENGFGFGVTSRRAMSATAFSGIFYPRPPCLRYSFFMPKKRSICVSLISDRVSATVQSLTLMPANTPNSVFPQWVQMCLFPMSAMLAASVLVSGVVFVLHF